MSDLDGLIGRLRAWSADTAEYHVTEQLRDEVLVACGWSAAKNNAMEGGVEWSFGTNPRVAVAHASRPHALAEGCVFDAEHGWWHVPGVDHPNREFPVLARPTAREMFAALWDVIHGSGAWVTNPWVVALTFQVRHGNIDSTQSLRHHGALT